METDIRHYRKQIEKHDTEIVDIRTLMNNKVDAMSEKLNNLSLAIKDVVIHQKDESIRQKLWMIGICIGFVIQIISGLIIIFIEQGGQ